MTIRSSVPESPSGKHVAVQEPLLPRPCFWFVMQEWTKLSERKLWFFYSSFQIAKIRRLYFFMSALMDPIKTLVPGLNLGAERGKVSRGVSKLMW